MGIPDRKPTSRTGESVSAEAFQRLLEQLGGGEVGAKQYLRFRNRLIRLFKWRGATFPEDLADETLFRIAQKLDEGVEIRADDPFRYVAGVAHLVFKEVLRTRRHEASVLEHLDRARQQDEGSEAQFKELQRALARLPESDRSLLLDYYEAPGAGRIESRRSQAERLGTSLNTLRVRVHRIRAKLEEELGRAQLLDPGELDEEEEEASPTLDAPSPETPVADFCVVWDPEVLDEQDYADLIVALGELARSYGAHGVQRVRSEGFRASTLEGVKV